MTFSRRDLYRLAATGGSAAVLPASFTTAVEAKEPKVFEPLGTHGTEPLGGQPKPGAKRSVDNFDYQIKYGRAFEAVLWNMPAIAIYSFRRSAFSDLGMKDNDIIACSVPATPKIEAITANSTTPYICAYTDLSKGPVVLEVPVSGPDGSLYGQVVDAWQFTIADVGPSGIDKGKGAKLLFTPPDFAGDIPAGYLHVPSPNYRIALAFRSIPAPGKTADDAYRYSKKLRMYYLSEATNPPEQHFVDPMSSRYRRYPTLPFYDGRHFEDMHAILSVEPVREHDKVMMGMLTSLGIEKGKPFSPDATAKRAMDQAVVDAWFFLQDWFDNMPPDRFYWPDRHYASLLQTDKNNRFTWEYEDRIDLINRAAEYFWCTYMPKELSHTPATQYMMAIADNQGRLLEGGVLYKLDVPADMPVKQFWALTVYDRATNAFIYTDENRTTLSSYDLPKMKKNPDGGVTLYIGPKAPKGLETNWIPTRGKRPLPAMRLYGPTEAFNDKTFKLADFERVG